MLGTGGHRSGRPGFSGPGPGAGFGGGSSLEHESPPDASRGIITAFLGNDPEAVGLVAGWARAVIGHRSWGLESPEDLVQSTMLAVTENFRKGRFTDGHLRAYVSRIARNLCVTSLRRRGTRGTSVPIELEQEPESPVRSGPTAERTALLSRVMGRLDPASQQILCLAYLSGLSRREIGEILGITEGAAKVRLCRCVRKARAILSGAEEREAES